jgi:hypothetical protein
MHPSKFCIFNFSHSGFRPRVGPPAHSEGRNEWLLDWRNWTRKWPVFSEIVFVRTCDPSKSRKWELEFSIADQIHRCALNNCANLSLSLRVRRSISRSVSLPRGGPVGNFPNSTSDIGLIVLGEKVEKFAFMSDSSGSPTRVTFGLPSGHAQRSCTGIEYDTVRGRGNFDDGFTNDYPVDLPEVRQSQSVEFTGGKRTRGRGGGGFRRGGYARDPGPVSAPTTKNWNPRGQQARFSSHRGSGAGSQDESDDPPKVNGRWSPGGRTQPPGNSRK